MPFLAQYPNQHSWRSKFAHARTLAALRADSYEPGLLARRRGLRPRWGRSPAPSACRVDSRPPAVDSRPTGGAGFAAAHRFRSPAHTPAPPTLFDKRQEGEPAKPGEPRRGAPGGSRPAVEGRLRPATGGRGAARPRGLGGLVCPPLGDWIKVQLIGAAVDHKKAQMQKPYATTTYRGGSGHQL